MNSFFAGLVTEIIFVIIGAEIHDGGAQSACMEIFHVKCELKYVPITDSTDEKTS